MAARTDKSGARHRGVVVLCVFMSGLFLTAMSPKDRGIHQAVTWTSSDGRFAHGIKAMAVSEKGMVHRLLIEGPGGQLVMLTSVVDALRGMQSARFDAVGADWQIELRESYGLEWPNLQAALESLAAGPDSPGMNTVVEMSLKDNLGFDHSVSLPRRQGGVIPDFMNELAKKNLRDSLAKNIPISVGEVLYLLTNALDSGWDPYRRVGAEAGGLLDITMWALEGQATSLARDEEAWPLPEVGDYQIGTLTDPELIELVAKFPDLDNVDPLSGTRPSDLFD